MRHRNQSESGSSAVSAPSAVKGFSLIQAVSTTEIALARELFLEYAQSLGFSLCFQNFDKELAELAGEPTGCVALHKLETRICEMKRLYLRPKFRGKGLGRILAETIGAEARQIGYDRMRLDTVEPVMKDAVGLYRKLGFREIAPYRPNPMPGTLYMELEL